MNGERSRAAPVVMINGVRYGCGSRHQYGLNVWIARSWKVPAMRSVWICNRAVCVSYTMMRRCCALTPRPFECRLRTRRQELYCQPQLVAISSG